MSCAGCARCEPGPVATLIDGRTVCTWCEDWRAECEARQILAMQPIQRRRDYLAGVKHKRGDKAGKALEELVRAVWHHERGIRVNP